MPVQVITPKNLPEALRKLIRGDEAAVRRAVLATLAHDAPRWIQWSIKGGGWNGGAGGAPPPKTPAKRSPKRSGDVSKVSGGKVSTTPKVKKGRRRKRCAPSAPPAYRQPVDTGDYKNSWKHSITSDGGIFYSDAKPPMKAGVIEEGRRPAPIPIAPLADWVRRKLRCPDPAQQRAIAIAISKAAAKTRRPGLFVLARAHPQIAEAFVKNVERELGGST